MVRSRRSSPGCGVDDADMEVVDEDDDVGSGVGSSDADVAEPAGRRVGHRRAWRPQGFRCLERPVSYVLGNTPPSARKKSRSGRCIRTGVRRIRFHDLRHTSATFALAAGIHPKMVSERLVHSSIAITLDLYGHVTPSLQAEAAEKLGAVLLGDA
jgi:integrase